MENRNSLQELESAFRRWREQKQYPTEPLPKTLAEQARAVAAVHGKSEVIRITGTVGRYLFQKRTSRRKVSGKTPPSSSYSAYLTYCLEHHAELAKNPVTCSTERLIASAATSEKEKNKPDPTPWVCLKLRFFGRRVEGRAWILTENTRIAIPLSGTFAGTVASQTRSAWRLPLSTIAIVSPLAQVSFGSWILVQLPVPCSCPSYPKPDIPAGCCLV